MPRILKTLVALAITGILLSAPPAASACSACLGRSDDVAVQGLNAAVLTLMAALLLVLGAAASFLAYLARKSARNPLAMPSTPGGEVQ